MYIREGDLFATPSSSTSQSGAYLAGDFTSLSLSVGAASALTVQGSNFEGLLVAIPENTWSTLTTIAAAGVFKVETGFKWMRAQRNSSVQTVTFFGQSRV